MIWNILFGVIPYIAVSIFLFGVIFTFLYSKYRISTRSSGFLENNWLFWGSVPWHYGIALVLVGHFIGFVAPEAVLSLTSDYKVLVIVNSIAFACGLMAFLGILLLLIRRIANRYVLAGTGFFDIAVVLLLLFQAGSGLYISYFNQWGINWFASNVSVYLFSLLKFAPNGAMFAEFPLILKLHALNFFVLLALLPFTRLIHILTVPIKYFFRRHIIVRWN